MDINYYLENIVTESLFGKYNIHLCCYTIYNNEYLLYLLELINEQYYFPHFKSKNNVLEESKYYLNKLKINGDIKGYYLIDINCYILIQQDINYTVHNTSPYIYASIYEMLFMRSCLEKMVHISVVQLFIQHPYLLYLYDTHRKDIPELGYYITENKLINYHTYIGLDSNEKGHIEIYNCEKIPAKSFIRVLSTLNNYNVKHHSNAKNRTIVIDKYMVVSHHKI